MLLFCLLSFIILTNGEYSFHFFFVFRHRLLIWFSIMHFLFFYSKSCPSNWKHWVWIMWGHSYRYVNLPLIHCISVWFTHLFPYKSDFPLTFFFFFFSNTGHVAFKIEATDPENDPLTYAIEGPGSHHFQMNSNTGEATLRSELDREVRFSGGTTYYIYICYAACVCLCAIVLINLYRPVIFPRR